MKLEEFRKARNLSMSELAYAAGISPNSVFRYEYGERKPGFATAYRLAKVLGCRMEDLLEDGEKVWPDGRATDNCCGRFGKWA